MKHKICIITASNGKNLELAQSFKSHLENKGQEVSFINVVDLDLPLYSPNAAKIHNSVNVIAPFKNDLSADAFIFVAPEYNGSTPPTFSNFLSWVSTSTKDWRETFNRKTALIASASAGSGLHVLAAMRMQLGFIGMNVLGRQVASTMSKPFIHEELEKIIDELLETIPTKK